MHHLCCLACLGGDIFCAGAHVFRRRPMVAGDHVAVRAAMDAVAAHHPLAAAGAVAQAANADSARAQPRDRAGAVHGVQMVLRGPWAPAGQCPAGVELQYRQKRR